ncbi:hypothetical protein GCQ56_02865 [Marinifilum sp. N1E240]|uniref:hypothetical protein n=1 Tax=Marinifilum sp. N1E240 TaxID=2608082 RepID=UPI00128B762A|nr:hypothetical protein [Marinifilum sp. N1E240]MPQ45941.1 hypothetical protein [Marinifilum sp. N1E240]
MKELLIILTLLLFSSFITVSQNHSKSYAFRKNDIKSFYNEHMHTKYDYISGEEYKPYHNYNQANPYLNSSHGSGIIFSKGRTYPTSIIYYDLFHDEVIVNLNDEVIKNSYIKINKVQIDSFSINLNNQHYHFVNLIRSNNISSGFYEIPYNHKFQLLIKHTVRKGKDNSLTTYKQKLILYLRKHEQFHNISSKKKFLSLFPEKNKQLKKKLKSLEINFKKPNHDRFVELIKYAETL